MDDHSWLPPLAPLSKPLADYLAGIASLPDEGRGRVTITNGIDLGEWITAHAHARKALSTRVEIARAAVYDTMRPIMGTGSITPVYGRGPLTTRVFLDLLQYTVHEVFADLSPHDRPSPTRSTIHRWRNTENGSGLLRYRDQDDIDPQSAAAILIARRVVCVLHNWLPSGRNQFSPEDLTWWCWCYEHPDACPIPCPMTHLADVPPYSFVVTPWRGAGWLEGWQVIPRGAFRWAGQPSITDQERWYANGILSAPEALRILIMHGQSTSEATSTLHALSSLLHNGYSTTDAVPVSLLNVIFQTAPTSTTQNGSFVANYSSL